MTFSLCLPTSTNRVVALIIESQDSDTRQGIQTDALTDPPRYIGTVNLYDSSDCRESAQVLLSSPSRDASVVEPLAEGVVYEVTGPSVEVDVAFDTSRWEILWPVRGIESGSVGYIWKRCLRYGKPVKDASDDAQHSGEQEASGSEELPDDMAGIAVELDKLNGSGVEGVTLLTADAEGRLLAAVQVFGFDGYYINFVVSQGTCDDFSTSAVGEFSYPDFENMAFDEEERLSFGVLLNAVVQSPHVFIVQDYESRAYLACGGVD